MTVYSALKLSRKAGVAVADEREVRYGSRAYDVARKIHQLTPASFVGFSGVAPYGEEIINIAKSRVVDLKEPSLRNVVSVLEKSYEEVRQGKFRTGILSKYGMTFEEFKRGICDEKIKEQLIRAAENSHGFEVEMSFGGYDEKEDDFILAVVAYPGTSYIEKRYVPIGTGSDRADLVIGDKLSGLDHEVRDNIPLHIGTRILMEATRSAWKNLGVGGSGQVVYVVEREYRELGRLEVNLLYNALYLEEEGDLSNNFVNRIFQRIMEKNEKAENLLPDLKKKINPEDMMRLFFLKSLHL